ncbi:MAG: PAS domain-containing protein [Candidatus Omnitrophota bacterium]
MLKNEKKDHSSVILKQKDTEIVTLKKQIEFILGATNTGIDIIDSDYNVRYVNTEWAKIYGDYIGRKCYEYFMGADKACPKCGAREALETKKQVISEEILVREGNRPIEVVSMPYQDEYGNWLVAEVNIDITERKKIEQKFKNYQAELELRVRVRTAELSNANDELNKEIIHRVQVEEELKEKMIDLERFAKIAVDRELKMEELERRIKELEAMLNTQSRKK